MQKTLIEKEARRVQYEIWTRRKNLWPLGEPSLVAMFDPAVVAKFLDLSYEIRTSLATDGARGSNFEAAGLLDRRRRIIAVSSKFPYPVQKFTGAHEIGHYLLHPSFGDGTAHRDRPMFGVQEGGRPVYEQEADYFAACLLVPKKLLLSAFQARFQTKTPLQLTDGVAFSLGIKNPSHLFSAPRGSLSFPIAVAAAQSFGGRRFDSLADCFGISPTAMAVRLRETEMVAD